MSGSREHTARKRPVLRPVIDGDGAPAARPHIEWVFVDGFGGVRDLQLAGFSPGLTVVLGPNEAGKSSVFDFLSAVMFGFPTRRRSDPRWRAPVPGAAHGGSIAIADGTGATTVIERYALPAKRFALSLPDGSRGDEGDLRRLLGGAGPELFRAVFAVDLDDLRRLDTMSSDEVREVIFSSGLLGASKSVARALRELDARRDDLVRPRQGGRANELAGRLSAVREQLGDARRRALGFPRLRGDLEEKSRALNALRAELRTLAARRDDLTVLLGCYESSRRLETLRRERAARPDPSPSELAHIAESTAISSLRAELSGHRERSRRLAELERRAAGLERSVAERTADLGAWAPAVASSPSFDAARLSELLEPLSERRRSALVTLRSAETASRHAEEDLAALQARCPPAPAGLLSAGELQHRLRALRELRSLSVEIDELERAPGRVDETARLLQRWALATCAVLVVASAVSGLLLLGHGGPLALLLLAFSAALALLTGFVAAKSGARPVAANAEAAAEGSPLERARQAQRRAAGEAGVAAKLSPASLQRLVDETEEALDERRQLDSAARSLLTASERVRSARLEVRRATDALATADSAVADFSRQSGLPPGSPEVLERLLPELDSLGDRMASLQQVARARDELAEELGRFEASVRGLAGRLGVTPPQADPSEREAGETEELELLLDVMGATLEDASERAEVLLALDSQIAELSGEIERQLGAGRRTESLRFELSESAADVWQSELESLERRRVDLDERLTEAIRQHHEVELELDELANSTDIAELEQQALGLEEELRETLRRYVVAGAARLVLRRTLRRYEEERQPAVLATAGAHFSRITGGRYARLALDASSELPSVRAVRSDGTAAAADELSRGTAEQLYLCLRLALAESFAEQYVALPIVLDDVLVNFDPHRQEAVARELASAARRHQVILLTCHPHVAELVSEASGGSAVTVEMKASSLRGGGVSTG